MAIWETPEVLSGPTQQLMGPDGKEIKPELGLCVIHQDFTTMEWATAFKFLNIPIPYVYHFNKNAPYDVAREQTTRACLEKGVKWIFHLDSDVVPKDNDIIPKLIALSEQNNLPVISGLYFAKKPGPPMPAAWVKIGEDKANNKIFYKDFDITPYLDQNALLQVDVVGAGCLLIRSDVFKKLDESDPKKPYFNWGLGRRDINGKPLLQVSEDFAFCERLNEIGVKPHISSALKCDHLCISKRRASDGQYELTSV